MRWKTLFIAACLLAVASGTAWPSENCAVCHRFSITGVHGTLPCLSCHGSEANIVVDPAAAGNRAVGCTGCHQGYGRLFEHAMATRAREQAFVAQTYGKADPGFYRKNCRSCHVTGCRDCHGGSGHRIAKPTDRECFACHRGYFTGTEYYGMAPREENLRYQRGETAYGETYLKMLPDVHAEAGLACGACHSMASLAAGKTTAKSCPECHRVDPGIIEHAIPAHLERMECYACHSAWAPQEYGTFYLRFADSPSREDYWLKENRGEYARSVYLRKQDAPPLGINAKGRVSPIRPEFIAYFTDIGNNRPVGGENRLLAARWKAFFPHTIRRGTVMCDGCHDNPRRFILERSEERIYRLQADGMTLLSFWERTGQQVSNGAFMPISRYRRMTAKSPDYLRGYVRKWQSLVRRVDNSSLP